MMDNKSAVRTRPPTLVHTATKRKVGFVEFTKPQSRPEPSAAAQRDSSHGSFAIQLIIVPEERISPHVSARRTNAFAYLYSNGENEKLKELDHIQECQLKERGKSRR